MKTMQEIIQEMRDGLDEMCVNPAAAPEWQKLNAVRFMECYRIMRALENEVENGR